MTGFWAGSARMATCQPPVVATLLPSTAVMMSPRRMPAVAAVPLGPTTATSCPWAVVPRERWKDGIIGTV